MQRVLVLGRGGAGKSTFAVRLGSVTSLPVTELDSVFWHADLRPTTPEDWVAVQRELTAPKTWILDGDLGPYDVLSARLPHADTVFVLDYSLWRCTLNAVRRSRENAAFWAWVWHYRRRSLPTIMADIAVHAPQASVYVFRRPVDATNFLDAITNGGNDSGPRRGSRRPEAV